jgi:hypothetical protein
VEVLALLAFVYVPPVYHVLGQHPLTAAQWVPILISPWVLLIAEETRELLVRKARPPVTRGPGDVEPQL